MTDRLPLSSWEGCLGERFRVATQSGDTYELELVAAEQIPAPSADAEDADAYSLLFDAPGEPLPQRLYRLEHERLGAHEMFIVPIGGEDGVIRYEAVFN